MKVLKKFNNSSYIDYNSWHKKKYWTTMSFVEFNFYQHRQAYLVSVDYPTFFFKYFLKMSKHLISNIKSLYSCRFAFSFFLINPFMYSKLKIKNFFFLDEFSINWFYNNTLNSNSIDNAFLLIKDFSSNINYCPKNKVFLDFNTFFISNFPLVIFSNLKLLLVTNYFKNSFLLKFIFYFLFFIVY